MFERFRRKRGLPDDVTACINASIASRSLAVAIAEVVRDYIAGVEAGDFPYPVHRSKDASVAEIWSGLRMEALHKLFNFGLSDPFILAEQEKQARLIKCWLVERPYLEFPQPHGEQEADTLQAVFHCYRYLSTAGSEVCDRLTDDETLRLKGRTVLDELNSEAGSLGEHRTLLEAVYDDVTAKAKSIALSARFGPLYEQGIDVVRKELLKGGHDTSDFDAATRRLLAGKSPDELEGAQ